jgi:hypothetical protein
MNFHIKKMITSYDEDVVKYQLGKENPLEVNNLIGKEVEFVYEGVINCIKCGRRTKTSFGQGFCYPCFQSAAEAAPCIIRPELCEAHLGKGRDVEWEQKHHNKEHFVYLAVSSAVKVGITNGHNIPYRWIDQGASYAIKFAKVPYRRLAGDIEVAMKEHFTDKTNWRKMLKNEILEDEDLEEVKWELEDILPSDLSQYMDEDDKVTVINYPVLQYPKKVTSINLEKTPVFQKKLVGVKGQYFIFEDETVINIRKYTGYNLAINF